MLVKKYSSPFCYTTRILVTPYVQDHHDQDQYQQPNDEVQLFSSQEPCLSSPTITMMKTNTSTSEEKYDCGEIEYYKNDCFKKFAESN